MVWPGRWPYEYFDHHHKPALAMRPSVLWLLGSCVVVALTAGGGTAAHAAYAHHPPGGTVLLRAGLAAAVLSSCCPFGALGGRFMMNGDAIEEVDDTGDDDVDMRNFIQGLRSKMELAPSGRPMRPPTKAKAKARRTAAAEDEEEEAGDVDEVEGDDEVPHLLGVPLLPLRTEEEGGEELGGVPRNDNGEEMEEEEVEGAEHETEAAGEDDLETVPTEGRRVPAYQWSDEGADVLITIQATSLLFEYTRVTVERGEVRMFGRNAVGQEMQLELELRHDVRPHAHAACPYRRPLPAGSQGLSRCDRERARGCRLLVPVLPPRCCPTTPRPPGCWTSASASTSGCGRRAPTSAGRSSSPARRPCCRPRPSRRAAHSHAPPPVRAPLPRHDMRHPSPPPRLSLPLSLAICTGHTRARGRGVAPRASWAVPAVPGAVVRLGRRARHHPPPTLSHARGGWQGRGALRVRALVCLSHAGWWLSGWCVRASGGGGGVVGALARAGGIARFDRCRCVTLCPRQKHQQVAGLRCPSAGAAAVASFLAAVLAEICLCNVCSCQETLSRNGRRRGQARARAQRELRRSPRTARHLVRAVLREG
eukprot:COSAG01_NODE_1694_length_9467_cov_4.976196_8_plen_592_part_00